MASPSALQGAPAADQERPKVVETTFKSVDATLAAQWDFPAVSPAPLVVMVPAAGKIDRHGWHPELGEDPGDGIYARFARQLVQAGFAVFRFDAPGAGRSGRGFYATERSNALEAYRRAVDHARIDSERVFLFGHSSGTDVIAGIYPRFESIAIPAGVVLMSNLVGEGSVTRIAAPTLIVVGGKDPDDRYQFGEFAAEARGRVEGKKLDTELMVVKNAQHALLSALGSSGREGVSLDPSATKTVLRWLMQKRG